MKYLFKLYLIRMKSMLSLFFILLIHMFFSIKSTKVANHNENFSPPSNEFLALVNSENPSFDLDNIDEKNFALKSENSYNLTHYKNPTIIDTMQLAQKKNILLKKKMKFQENYGFRFNQIKNEEIDPNEVIQFKFNTKLKVKYADLLREKNRILKSLIDKTKEAYNEEIDNLASKLHK